MRSTVLAVLGLTLDDAKTIAVVGAALFAVAAVVSFWIMKTVATKLVTAVLLALLAFGVWSQRVSLQECADKVQESYVRAGTEVTISDTDCSFFGFTITISDPRPGDDA